MRNCALSSIKLVEKELPEYLPFWMGRPLAELSKLECVKRHAKQSGSCGPMMSNKVLNMLGAAFGGAASVYENLPELPPTSVIRSSGGRRREHDVLVHGSEGALPVRARSGTLATGLDEEIQQVVRAFSSRSSMLATCTTLLTLRAQLMCGLHTRCLATRTPFIGLGSPSRYFAIRLAVPAQSGQAWPPDPMLGQPASIDVWPITNKAPRYRG